MEHQLAELLDNSEDNDLTDLSFIKKASAFLVTQRIVSNAGAKECINYAS